MNISYKYTNGDGETVTEFQASSLDSYKRKTYYDNLLKIEEFYVKGRGKNRKITTYFLDNTEDKNTIIGLYCDVNDGNSCTLYFSELNNGLNSLWDREEYTKDGILKFRGKDSFDSSIMV